MIVGIPINNLLLTLAGGANANRQTDDGTLTMPDDQLAAAFAMLLQNAESGLTAENTGKEGATAFLNRDSDKEQPNPHLFGLAMANFLTGGRTEIPMPAAKAEETTLSVSGVESDADARSVLNTVYSLESAKSVDISGLTTPAKPEQAQSFRTAGAVEFGSVFINSETKAEPENRAGQLQAQYAGKPLEANAKPASESVFQPNVQVKRPDEAKNIFAFKPVGAADSLTSAQPAQAQNAFQSDLKAVRTELDAKVGFRMRSAFGQNAADNETSENPLPETVWTTGKEQTQTAIKTEAHANPEPEVQLTVPDSGKQVGASNAVPESDAEAPLTLDIGTDSLKAKSIPAESDKFDAQHQEESGVGTERVHDFNAAAQSEAPVHSTSAAEATDSQPKPSDSVVLQLEAPIKKEAAKGTNTSFKIRLKPEGLGEVTVDLKHVSGKLEVTIKTELSSTKELISENIQTLRNALAADDGPKALSLASLTVEQDAGQFGAFSQSGFGGERHSQPSAGNNFGFQASTEHKVNSTVRYRTGLIDYTV